MSSQASFNKQSLKKFLTKSLKSKKHTENKQWSKSWMSFITFLLNKRMSSKSILLLVKFKEADPIKSFKTNKLFDKSNQIDFTETQQWPSFLTLQRLPKSNLSLNKILPNHLILIWLRTKLSKLLILWED